MTEWNPPPMPNGERWPVPPHLGGLPTLTEVRDANEAAVDSEHAEGCVRPKYHGGACERADGWWMQR